jgi:hypothetical protein
MKECALVVNPHQRRYGTGGGVGSWGGACPVGCLVVRGLWRGMVVAVSERDRGKKALPKLANAIMRGHSEHHDDRMNECATRGVFTPTHSNVCLA